MTAPAVPRSVGAPLARLEAVAKVTGEARYAYEHAPGQLAYCSPVQATIARGEVRDVDVAAPSAPACWPCSGPATRPSWPTAAIPSWRCSSRAPWPTAGRSSPRWWPTRWRARARRPARWRSPTTSSRTTSCCDGDHPKLYTPEKVNPSFPSETGQGDPDAALAAAAVSVDVTYTTPAFHNNPMEPHATVAVWEDGGLTLYDSTQGAVGRGGDAGQGVRARGRSRCA